MPVQISLTVSKMKNFLWSCINSAHGSFRPSGSTGGVPIRTCLLIVIFAAAFLCSGCESRSLAPVSDEPFFCGDESWITAKRDPLRFIAHAGGEIDGRRYTNAREALDLAYGNGFRLFEIDLIETGDGRLVGAHDWDSWRMATGSRSLEPSYHEFKNTLLFNSYRTVDLADLDRWFGQRPDAYLVTDKVTDFKSLTEGFFHADRLIVEVFSSDDFRLALRHGIKYPMLSLRSALANDGEAKVLELLRTVPVKFVAVASKVIRRHRDLLRDMRRNHTCVYVFTSSDPDYLKTNIGQTVYGAYTDSWDLSIGTCTTRTCDTY